MKRDSKNIAQGSALGYVLNKHILSRTFHATDGACRQFSSVG